MKAIAPRVAVRNAQPLAGSAAIFVAEPTINREAAAICGDRHDALTQSWQPTYVIGGQAV